MVPVSFLTDVCPVDFLLKRGVNSERSEFTLLQGSVILHRIGEKSFNSFGIKRSRPFLVSNIEDGVRYRKKEGIIRSGILNTGETAAFIIDVSLRSVLRRSAQRSILLNWFCVAPFALIQRKSDPAVAQTAVPARGYIEHGIFHRALLGARKYIGMADLAAVPHDVLLVGKDDVRHPGAPGSQGEVLLHVQGQALQGYAGKVVGGVYEPVRFGFFPIDEVSHPVLRKFFRECGIVVFFPDILAHGMAQAAPCSLLGLRVQ
jgi:hypothetical protein